MRAGSHGRGMRTNGESGDAFRFIRQRGDAGGDNCAPPCFSRPESTETFRHGYGVERSCDLRQCVGLDDIVWANRACRSSHTERSF